MARPRLTRVLIAPIALSTIAAGIVLAPLASSASADISSRITSAKAQLAKLQDQSEVAAEAYDAGRIKLAAANRKAAQMQAKAAASAARLVKAKQSVAAIATLAYSQGATGDTTMLYQSSDPAGFVDRAAMVDSLSRNDVSILGSVHAAQQDATITARAAAQAVAAAKAVVAELARDKAQVQASAAQEGKILDTLVAQQKEQIRQAAIALAKAIHQKRLADAARYRAAQAAAVKAERALEAQRAAHQRAAQAFTQQQDSNAGTSSNNVKQADTSSGSSSSGSGSGSAGSGASSTKGSVGSGSSSGSSGSGGSSSGGGSGSGSASGSVGGSGSGSTSSAAATAVHWAYNELGKSYVWAASGPDHFDCSGLTMYVYAQAGVYLPHSSAAQFGSGRHVSQSELRPGDLVFYGSPIHHVGIYVGNGNMIESPHSGASVEVSGAFRGDYVGAVRVSG
ncbi:MAG: peptidoglycan DL-endopeptidase CwlO [Frankiales bacterium]|nr:peptidoglycan DL-endopeptidase CwlO [Frankiales bacterium]